MSKIDKKILEDIDILSKAMEKNKLSEIKYSDENSTYELKKFQKNEYFSSETSFSGETKSTKKQNINPTENALKSPLVGTALSHSRAWSKKIY